MTQPRIDDGARRCMAALVYVYDHETRQLSKRLMDDHHSHSDLSIAAVHVHVDAESCLESRCCAGRRRRWSISPSMSSASAACATAGSSWCRPARKGRRVAMG